MPPLGKGSMQPLPTLGVPDTATTHTAPASNFSTALVLMVAVVGLWLLLKMFVRIVLLAISLGVSVLAGAVFHAPAVPYVERLYLQLGTQGLPLLGAPPDPRLTAFAAVFLTTFLLTSFLLAAVSRRS